MNFLRYIVELMTLLQQCERLSDAIHHAKSAPFRQKIMRRKGMFSIAMPSVPPERRWALCHHSGRLSAMDLLRLARWRHGGLDSWGLLHAVWQFRYAGPAYCQIHYRFRLGRIDKPYLQLRAASPLSDFRCWWRRLPRSICLPGHCRRGRPRLYGDGDYPDAACAMRAGRTLQRRLRRRGQHRYRSVFATGFAVIGMSLLQTVQADAAINRLLKLCQRDIRRSVNGVFKGDETHWTNLMIDRAALLLPRLPRAGRHPHGRLRHGTLSAHWSLCDALAPLRYARRQRDQRGALSSDRYYGNRRLARASCRNGSSLLARDK